MVGMVSEVQNKERRRPKTPLFFFFFAGVFPLCIRHLEPKKAEFSSSSEKVKFGTFIYQRTHLHYDIRTVDCELNPLFVVELIVPAYTLRSYCLLECCGSNRVPFCFFIRWASENKKQNFPVSLLRVIETWKHFQIAFQFSREINTNHARMKNPI